MKTIILRKPKFLRNEKLMQVYIDIAHTISKTCITPDLTLDQQLYMLSKIGECLNKAAKAGGFFSTLDLLKYLESRKTH